MKKVFTLTGTSEAVNNMTYLFNDDFYITRRITCSAEAEKLVASSNGIDYDGLFTVDLYSQNTATFKRSWLKKLGYKVSGLNAAKLDDLIISQFLSWEKQ